jgi:hypothetical protein
MEVRLRGVVRNNVAVRRREAAEEYFWVFTAGLQIRLASIGLTGKKEQVNHQGEEDHEKQ